VRALVVLSGGMDSATLLYHLIAEDHDVRAITFDYRQRHRREVYAARHLAACVRVPYEVVEFELPFGRDNALTGGRVPVPHGHYEDASMRATVVPNRNMTLVAVATASAIAQGCSAVAYGAHAGDHTIYPDCRPAFVDAMRAALAVCHYEPIALLTPFLHWSKREIAWRGAGLGVPFASTWTCYEGGAVHCGRCGACVERREALAEIPGGDPTSYVV
jgi:7-cyano-7-deazaguanine synthase